MQATLEASWEALTEATSETLEPRKICGNLVYSKWENGQ